MENTNRAPPSSAILLLLVKDLSLEPLSAAPGEAPTAVLREALELLLRHQVLQGEVGPLVLGIGLELLQRLSLPNLVVLVGDEVPDWVNN